MARGFGTGQGVGTTDSIELPFAAHATTRTYVAWVYAATIDATARRIVEKRVAGVEVEVLYVTTGACHFIRTWTGVGHWTFPLPTTSTWTHLAMAYNAVAGTAPLAWLNGATQTVSTSTNSSGTVTNNADNYVLGNRKNDNARGFIGRLADFAIYDRLLSTPEVVTLARGASPLHIRNGLVSYAPLARGTTDHCNGAAVAVTGTAVQDHPRTYHVKTSTINAAGAADPIYEQTAYQFFYDRGPSLEAP